MDHQWGNFLPLGQGGWDWLSIQLDDGRDLMLWHTRDASGKVVYGNGTLVGPGGETTVLEQGAFSIEATGRWTSPASGTTYPSGWRVELPGLGLRLALEPLLKDQELRTPQSTRVTYWEGAVDVRGDQRGRAISGQGYVELTGYGAP